MGQSSDPLTIAVPAGHMWHGQFPHMLLIAALLPGAWALAVALFQHAYIWAHWYCTEQPDSVVLYGPSPVEE